MNKTGWGGVSVERVKEDFASYALIVVGIILGVASVWLLLQPEGRVGAIVGVFLTSISGTFIAFHLADLVRKKRHRAMANKGAVEWVGEALIVSGGRFLEGEHLPINPPGPKGTLAMKGGVVRWKPYESTAQKGYATTLWKKGQYRLQYGGASRSITGIFTETCTLVNQSGEVKMQIVSPNTPLKNYYQSRKNNEK